MGPYPVLTGPRLVPGRTGIWPTVGRDTGLPRRAASGATAGRWGCVLKRGTMISRMARVELDIPDAPGCPLLGLAVDRRTRYTFPHPDHRCHAGGSPSTIEPGRQSTYCLSLEFAGCDRYLAWQRLAENGQRPNAAQASRKTLA
jgi:hypothetical protein